MDKTYSIQFTLKTDIPIGPLVKNRIQQAVFRAICKYFDNNFRTKVGVKVEEVKEVIQL